MSISGSTLQQATCSVELFPHHNVHRQIPPCSFCHFSPITRFHRIFLGTSTPSTRGSSHAANSSSMTFSQGTQASQHHLSLSPQRCQSPLWLLGDWRWGWRVFQQRELRNNVVVVQQALCLRPGSAAGRRRGLRKGGSWRSRVSSVWSFRAGKRGMRSLTSTSWSMHGSHSTGGQGLMELHGMWTWSYGTGWSRAGWTSLRYWAWRLRTFKSSSLVSSRYPGPVSHLSTTLGATIVGHCASSPLTR